ncbi:MAG: hypothetical protein ABIR19_10575 [Ginsengibacter sp.]
MYAQLPPGSYPESIYVQPGLDFIKVVKFLEESSLSFPVAVKPDAGMMGFMFRIIQNVEQLGKYHAVMHSEYIIQQLVGYPLEVSVFYYRLPGSQSGRITGFIKKEFLEVTGDGYSTLKDLILKYSRVRFRRDEILSKHLGNLSSIIPLGKTYCLSYALNLSRGGRLISLEGEKTESLLQVFDKLSLYTQSFFYGRYDVKCTSIEDLRKGINFSILEYNGSGAEPHHIYGNGNTLLAAYKIILHHWKILYIISRINYRNGISYWKYRDGLRFLSAAKKHFRQLKKLDVSFEI